MNGDFEHAYFPVSLDLDGRLAVVVGGGMTAEEHVSALLRYGADVLVVAPQVTQGLEELVAQGVIEHESREYVRGDLGGAFVSICAVPSIETCRAVYQEAEGCGCLIMSVGAPELCNFILPAVVERGLLQVSVSTAGASPEVAFDIRDWLEAEFGPEWVDYVQLLGQVRKILTDRITDRDHLQDLIDRLMELDLRTQIAAGDTPVADDVYRDLLLGIEGDDGSTEATS